MQKVFSLTVMPRSDIEAAAGYHSLSQLAKGLSQLNFDFSLSVNHYEKTEVEEEAGEEVSRYTREDFLTGKKHPDDVTDQFFSDENTLLKVRESLMQYGMTETEALNAINDMQNKGILFRERH
jgi:hypothetical protein